MSKGDEFAYLERADRRGWRIAGVALLVIAALAAGYEAGRRHTERRLHEAAQFASEYEDARERIEALERRVADEALSRTVDGDAQEQLRSTIKSLRDELADAREEVRFYRQLMAPSEAERGLRVERLTLRAGAAPGTFDYRLLLTQVVERHGMLAGNVRMSIAGTQGEDEVVLPLTRVAKPGAYPIPFKFRYFEDVSGTLTLPEEFVPARVVVLAVAWGGQAKQVERAFEWVLEAE
jgi:hypothetical protein